MCRNWGDTAKGVYALSYCVRLMTRDDIPRVSMLDREIFPSMKMHTNFQNELKNCLAYYIVVYKKGEASGCVAGVDNIIGYAGLWTMVGEAHVVNIAVSHNFRGQGIGELLLIALIELALNVHCNMITLEVRVSNTTAQKLYGKYGFTVRGIRTGYYTDNREDGVIMTVDNIDGRGFKEEFKRLKSDYHKKRGAAEIILTAPLS
ncbi:MAG: ribosomal protein S18-alanine N-acetyltransferase [Dehalococcoidales bacterium]|nr:ribosomal protein S18-alanine N-acetyltransferase [Dehalococcoidales bacterium]